MSLPLRLGRYEKVRPIASGGMATVFLGRVLGAGGFERLVAIKELHAHIAKDPQFVSMFLDEARLAARIRHLNVVSTIDVHQSQNELFLVMEYIEGPSLYAVLKSLRKAGELLPVGIAIRMMLDVLAGLHAAHELTGPSGQPLHLVHRDVSPQNVLVGTDGIVRITDFGIAQAESRLTSTVHGQLKGKFPYMSPEQIRAEPVDRRCDIWAAAVVFWEMLAGKKLFRAENNAALVAKIAHGALPTPREVQPSVPAEISSVCMAALNRSRELRHESAAELAEELELAAGEAGVEIASARAVVSLIKRLALDVRLTDEPLPTTPSEELRSGSRKRSDSSAPSSGAKRSGSDAPEPLDERAGELAVPEAPGEGTRARAVTHRPGAPTKGTASRAFSRPPERVSTPAEWANGGLRPRRLLGWFGAALFVAVVVGGAWFVRRQRLAAAVDARKFAPNLALQVDNPRSPARLNGEVATMPTVVGPPPSLPASSLAEPAVPVASAVASSTRDDTAGPARSATPPRTRHQAAPSSRQPAAKRAPPSPDETPPPSATSYRPTDL